VRSRLRLTPVPLCWLEDTTGNKYPVDLEDYQPPSEPERWKYLHSHFHQLFAHPVFHANQADPLDLAYSENLALALVDNENMRFSQALAFVLTCCERCHNILNHEYGLLQDGKTLGYARDSRAARETTTWCECCAQVDPEYHHQQIYAAKEIANGPGSS
jgi:hypothetical protein